MNGIISKGGKPVKEDEDLEKIVKELEKASQTHLGQSKRIKKHIDKMEEEVEIDESDKAMMMKLTTKAMKAIPNSPDQKELIKQVNVYRKKLGMKPMKEENLNEKIEGLVKKAEKSGISYGILKKVYDRGMAAWKTGHRQARHHNSGLLHE